MATTLFDTISLGAVQVAGVTHPCIYIVPMRKPAHIYGTDYFLLEKYALNKADPVLMNTLVNVITYQKVQYYMSENIYMCTYMHMTDGYDLGVDPTWIDLYDTFHDGDDQYIDLDTNVDANYYVYRLVYRNGINEFASEYIMGLQATNFSESWEDIADILPEDLVGIRASHGTGRLYRTSRAGIMVMKGMPMMVTNPRYRGPIESAKETCRRYSKERTLSLLNSKMDSVDAFIAGVYDDMAEMGSEIAHRIQML